MSKTLRKLRIFLSGAIVLLALLGAAGYCRWTRQVPAPLLEILVQHIQLPPGFKIEPYATGVPNARSLTLGAGGTVFVGSKRAGKVYALLGNGRHDKAGAVITIARGLDEPNGVAFHDGSLCVAEVNRVLRYDAIEARLRNPPAPADHARGFLGRASQPPRSPRPSTLPAQIPCSLKKVKLPRGVRRWRRPGGNGRSISW